MGGELMRMSVALLRVSKSPLTHCKLWSSPLLETPHVGCKRDPTAFRVRRGEALVPYHAGVCEGYSLIWLYAHNRCSPLICVMQESHVKGSL